MARPSPYSDSQKTAILGAVSSARKTGTWQDALKAAQGEGFKGKLPYLQKFAGGGKRRGRPKGAKAGARKVGRPKGSGTVARNGTGLNAIDAIVEKMVEARISAALSRAVATLETAAKELRKL